MPINSLQQQSSSHEIAWSGWHRSTQSKKKIHLHLQHYTIGNNNNNNTAADVVELYLHWIFCSSEQEGVGEFFFSSWAADKRRKQMEKKRGRFSYFELCFFLYIAQLLYTFSGIGPLLLFSGAELWPALAPVLSLSQNTGAQTIPAEPKSMQMWDFFISFWNNNYPAGRRCRKSRCWEQQQDQLRTVSANFIFSFAGLGLSLLFYVVIWLLWSSSMPELRVLCRICFSTIISSLRNKDKQEMWKEKFVD